MSMEFAIMVGHDPNQMFPENTTQHEFSGSATSNDWERTEGCRAANTTASETALSFQQTGSISSLLGLPFEIRQKIFEHVFTVPSGGSFPDQGSLAPSRLLGLIGNRYLLPNPASPGRGTSRSNAKANAQALGLCRQLHREMRLMPFQLNELSCPVTFGSNTSATKQFLQGLKPFQRRAIRQIEIHLLASVTEAWSLRSILREIAGVPDDDRSPGRANSGGDTTPATDLGLVEMEDAEEQDPSAADVRSLSVHITTRDLLLPQADSLTGLLHILSIATPSELVVCPSPAHGAASWVIDGLTHLTALKRLSITLELSEFVANQVSASARNGFAQAVQEHLPWVSGLEIQWKVQKKMILCVDDNDWVDLLWWNDTIPAYSTPGGSEWGTDEYAASQGLQGVDKVGFANWPSVAS